MNTNAYFKGFACTDSSDGDYFKLQFNIPKRRLLADEDSLLSMNTLQGKAVQLIVCEAEDPELEGPAERKAREERERYDRAMKESRQRQARLDLEAAAESFPAYAAAGAPAEAPPAHVPDIDDPLPDEADAPPAEIGADIDGAADADGTPADTQVTDAPDCEPPDRAEEIDCDGVLAQYPAYEDDAANRYYADEIQEALITSYAIFRQPFASKKIAPASDARYTSIEEAQAALAQTAKREGWYAVAR